MRIKKELTGIILTSLLIVIEGCGITTHTEIAHRASYQYEYLLNNQTSVAQV